MLNKIMIIGNLGKNPEIKEMPNGEKICNISVATTESWKDKKTGMKKESTEWHHVIFYRQLAEIAAKYLKKGSKVYIEGSVKTSKWEDKEGQARYTTNVIGREMKMLGSANNPNAQPNANQNQGFANQAQSGNHYQDGGFNSDSIPF